MSTIVPSNITQNQTRWNPVPLSGYSWPPSKPYFIFRSFTFENGKWIGSYNWRGNIMHLHFDSHEKEGKFITAKLDSNQTLSFQKVQGGWLGRIQLRATPSHGKALLLLHLSDQGDAGAGLWDLDKKAFYSFNARTFLERPNILPVPEKEESVPTPAQLPIPFACHWRNLPYLLVLGDPLRHDWGSLKFRLVSKGSHLAWTIQRKMPDYSRDEIELPTGNQAQKEASGNFFSNWKRGNGKWVGTQPLPLGSEAFGSINEARLKLTLYDIGTAVLTLEEEKPGGEKILHRLDPKWLSSPREKPKVYSSQKLLPDQDFDDIEFKKDTVSQALMFDSPEMILPPVPGGIRFGDVMI